MANKPSSVCLHRILQWNCSGLRPKLPELKQLLRKTPYSVLCLQEANLPVNMRLSGYCRYTTPAIPYASHGSAAVFVAKHLPQLHLPTTHLSSACVELVAVKVKLGNNLLTVASIYIRPCSTSNNVQLPPDYLLQVKAALPGPLLLCGDLNAHHPLWGSHKTDTRGQTIANSLQDSDLLVANTGEPTFIRAPHSSAIDVTLHTPDVPAHWEIGMDTWGSDHFPISITLAHKQHAPKRKLAVVNWSKFRTLLASDSKLDITEDITTALKAATSTIAVRSGDPKPDLKFLNLCAARRRAQRTLRKHYSPANLTIFRRISAVLRRYAVSLGREQWRAFSASLDCHTPARKIWGVAKSMMGSPCTTRPFESLAMAKGLTMPELAETFADEFSKGRSLPVTSTQLASTQVMDTPFTATELQGALTRTRPKSAPGADGVNNQSLRNLPEAAFHRLLDAINLHWSQGCPPRNGDTALLSPS